MSIARWLRTPLLLIGLASVAWLSACTHVHPYQREDHARITNRLDERGTAIRGFKAHVWAVREGAAGGNGEAGGGCGCN